MYSFVIHLAFATTYDFVPPGLRLLFCFSSQYLFSLQTLNFETTGMEKIFKKKDGLTMQAQESMMVTVNTENGFPFNSKL